MKRILVVSDDREELDFISKCLVKEEGVSVQNAIDSDAAIHRVRAWKPHFVLISADLPNMIRLELVPKIRSLTGDEYTPILMIGAGMTLEQVNRAFSLGVDDFLAKPFEVQEFVAKIRAISKVKDVFDSLKRANHRIEELTSTDDLTGLSNMRTAYRRGEEEIIRARRQGKNTALLLVNLDGFSGVNQTYGFMVGSHVLQEVAMRIRQCVRSSDLVARIGADEFFIILVETDLRESEVIAERIRESIQFTSFNNEKERIKLTASIGLAGLLPSQTSQKMSDLLHSASEALRLAKANGNNRTEIFTSS